MTKNMKIQKLIEIAKKNNYNYLEMAHRLGVGTATWNRWTNGKCEPTNKNTIEKIDKIISKHQ